MALISAYFSILVAQKNEYRYDSNPGCYYNDDLFRDFDRYFGHHFPRSRHEHLLYRKPPVAVVSGGFRHAGVVIVGRYVYFGAGQCGENRIRVFPGGYRVPGWLLGYYRRADAVVLPVTEPDLRIYTYLEQRFSFWSYKTGAFFFFLVSRTIRSSLRLFLAATVQLFLFDAWHVPFYVTVATTIILIWVYTFKGGVKTIVWTDSFQTIFLVTAVIIAVWQIASRLDMSFGSMVSTIYESEYSKMFNFSDVNAGSFFVKQFLGGMFITIAMTGLDQEIMQKNLTCKNLGEAQKNMFWFSLILVVVNLLFLVLGALLYIYSSRHNVTLPASSDELFPRLALNDLGLAVGIFFLLGITASVMHRPTQRWQVLPLRSVSTSSISRTNPKRKGKSRSSSYTSPSQ